MKKKQQQQSGDKVIVSDVLLGICFIFAGWCQAVSEKVLSFWQHRNLVMKMFKNNSGQTERLNDRWTDRWMGGLTDRQKDRYDLM